MRTSWPISGLVCAAALASVAAWQAQAAECVDPPTIGARSEAGAALELIISDMASTPSGAVVLAGRFHDGAATRRPALLVSRDGGRDWTRIPLAGQGAGFGSLATAGDSAIWGVISFRQEGLDTPMSLLRSTDSGASWCVVPLDAIEPAGTIESLRFFDELTGLMVVADAFSGNPAGALLTANGGDTWSPLWVPAPGGAEEIDRAFVYPDDDRPPPHAPLWQAQAGRYSVAGILRVRAEADDLVIEHYDYRRADGWQERSRIARFVVGAQHGPKP
ncbi:MAG: exo-alpha-sialidase [Inquilinus sp.]|nr:exo-alpha-sialidase [Inquilinus sp.]